MIDLAFLKRAAKLAYISLHEEEIEPLRKDLTDILNFVDDLKDVDTQNVEPLTACCEPFVMDVSELETAQDEDDVPRGNIPCQEVLSNAPLKDKGHFLIPRFVS